MDRYHIIKRMRKLLNRLSLYLQGTVMTESQVKNIIEELEGLVKISEESGKIVLVPREILTRVNFFLEAFKHHMGIEQSNDPEVMGMEDLKNFLSKELGIKVNKDYIFHPHRKGIPLHLLFI